MYSLSLLCRLAGWLLIPSTATIATNHIDFWARQYSVCDKVCAQPESQDHSVCVHIHTGNAFDYGKNLFGRFSVVRWMLKRYVVPCEVVVSLKYYMYEAYIEILNTQCKGFSSVKFFFLNFSFYCFINLTRPSEVCSTQKLDI